VAGEIGVDSKAKLMIVDDDEDNVTLLRMVLEDDYTLCEARSGLQCLASIAEEQPNLILLDVCMSGISGYEVCRRLKQNPGTAMIPIIFISAGDLPEQRLEGYEAGGDEYIVKPVDAELLFSKIRSTLEIHIKQKALQREASSAMSAALEAMTASSEMGLLVRFLEQSNHCEDFDQLHAAVTEIATQFGLDTCCLMHDGEKFRFFDCAPQSPEVKIMINVRDNHRIYDFGPRTIFSERNFSMLVKNMPLDEPNHLGRIKDNIAILVNMVDTRIKSIQMGYELTGQRNSITKSLILITEEKLQIINTKISSHERKLESTMQTMIEKLENKLIFLGLEEDQELALRQLAADTTEEVTQLGTFSEELNNALTDVLEGLYKLLEKQ